MSESAEPSSQPSSLTFAHREAHRAWLQSQAVLPAGFRAHALSFEFTPLEVSKPAQMSLSLLALDEPTSSFAGMFTRNAFPGAPVLIGRHRLAEPTLGAVVINNKISNVCAPDGVATSETICTAAAQALGLASTQVMPSSTGIIGWQLPRDEICAQLPQLAAGLHSEGLLSVAEGIMTTDLYPKLRRVSVGNGSVVGIAKGAGMVEPNLATMLVYILTDLQIEREQLRSELASAVNVSFNAMSIDSDTSTSDTVLAMSSNRVAGDPSAISAAIHRVCMQLAEDVARNGEGVHHVIQVQVSGAPSVELARGIGKSVVNSPLLQCAICGNDPNVGRLVCTIGKFIGPAAPALDLSGCVITVGGEQVFADGAFQLNPEREQKLHQHLLNAELYASQAPADGLSFVPPVDYPPHERMVTIAIDLGCGSATARVVGTDRSHEYITENADYRS